MPAILPVLCNQDSNREVFQPTHKFQQFADNGGNPCFVVICGYFGTTREQQTAIWQAGLQIE